MSSRDDVDEDIYNDLAVPSYMIDESPLVLEVHHLVSSGWGDPLVHQWPSLVALNGRGLAILMALNMSTFLI